ncbi:hypothetical protein COUCH_28650 [Couchioplanes caeruleus]|uniref:hypothetical protein n=1 Tax=Couchioplanes caeruleus TaxID=56438 RepID=UPI0020C10D3C|nr:hypothetical protein [Couchioplanes caeruleus]UQU62978.1 hypothetical protein COUCH_28650 [Couchioplanes caeruleus]
MSDATPHPDDTARIREEETAAAPTPPAPRDRWYRRRTPLLIAAAALLLGCCLGGGVVAVGALIVGGHDRGHGVPDQRGYDRRDGGPARGPGGGWRDGGPGDFGGRGRPGPVPSTAPSAPASAAPTAS